MRFIVNASGKVAFPNGYPIDGTLFLSSEKACEALNKFLTDVASEISGMARQENVATPCISTDEMNELKDILCTIAPTGRAFITSARALRAKYERQNKELERLRGQLAQAENRKQETQQ